MGWTLALQAIGAFAGVGVLATFVGGAMLWLRFSELHLPADRAVALLPNELLVVIGAQALAIPVLAGIVAALAVLLLPKRDDRITGVSPERLLFLAGLLVFAVVAAMLQIELAAFLVMALIAILGYVVSALIDDLDLGRASRRGQRIATVGFATVVAMTAAWHLVGASPNVNALTTAAVIVLALGALGLLAKVASARPHIGHLALVSFAVFAVLGAATAILRTHANPTMEPFAVLFKDDARGLAGFLVGETSDRLFFVHLPGNGDPGDPLADMAVDRVMAVERTNISQLAMREPVGVRPDEPGREQANTLLADLKQEAEGASTKPRIVTTVSPEVAFAPLVHLHSDDELRPMSARGFVDNSVLVWSNRGAEGPGCDSQKVRDLEERRLGIGPDHYVYSTGEGCSPAGRTFLASDHTRPYDERPGGLAPAQGWSLDLDDEERDGRQDTAEVGAQHYVENVPAYFDKASTTPSPARRKALVAQLGRKLGGQVSQEHRLTYWLFYGLSRSPGIPDDNDKLVHEGDWERIVVYVAGLGPEGSSRYVPLSVRYHHHNESRLLPWYAVRRVVGGGGSPDVATHPAVYSAKGSHASYWRAGRYELEFKRGDTSITNVYDEAIACSECPQWRTWDLLLNARNEGWYGFGGAWGQVGSASDFTGPTGPSPYKDGGGAEPTSQVVSGAAPVPTAPTDVQELTQ
jgi:hypothetical protein